MRAVGEGRLTNTSDAFNEHINRCLGCRACEQVCPAGVEYGQLLESSRAELRAVRPISGITNRLLGLILRHVWLQPRRLRIALAGTRIFRDSGVAGVLLKLRIAKLISARLEFALALLESSAPEESARRKKTPNVQAQKPTDTKPSRSSVMLFTGCVTEALFSRVNQATARVLEANNFAVTIPTQQVCCGALHAHAGDLEGARVLARQNIQAFTDSEAASIITNAGGCGAMLSSYDHLLAHDEELAADAKLFSARVRDVSQQLQTVAVRKGSSLGEGMVTYDASCHLLYGQHAADASLEMLQTIPDLPFVGLQGSERCCGGAGIYNLVEPEMSQGVLREKLTQIQMAGANILTTGNPGCQMQIGAGARLAGCPLRVCHPVELVDESYRRAGYYD